LLKEETPDFKMPELQLIIVMTADGRVNVTGPIVNKGICYQMLELAKDAIRDFKPSQIQAPNLSARLASKVANLIKR